jgi:hypothetical protein
LGTKQDPRQTDRFLEENKQISQVLSALVQSEYQMAATKGGDRNRSGKKK